MLAHVPILAHGAVRRVAIVGGGDGGALEEVLKHDVERAVMIEIDASVVELCREYLPSISGAAFEDPRHELVIADGLQFMKETDETFDVIIIDSTDPDGPSVPLFSPEFYADCRDRLSERGILVTQSGVTFMQKNEARETHARLNPLFADATLYLTQVPTYGAGYMTLGWGCCDVEPRRTALEEIEQRFAAAAIDTQYYSPAVHVASFALPGYIEALKG
jgi:spermidine synthase